MEKLLKKGAEADIYVTKWFGEEVVTKIRKPKTFMHPKLDAELRRHRTIREASFLSDAKDAGVLTPFIYYVDSVKGEIVMEYVTGKRLKDVLLAERLEKVAPVCEELGRCIAKLHKKNIIHGDLSTSNFIINDRALTFIDFGLSSTSQRLEDKAVDLHLVKQVLKSAHGKIWEKVFQLVLRGYGEIAGSGQIDALLAKIKEIERRGRYARVE
ncbi:MAG: Kae1-associated serine/threonine protein kinase [Thaumarchaeota archaeon]|nr:Kae1-associated serine/threonine protein kinase [Nitrososphaerota archaeon]